MFQRSFLIFIVGLLIAILLYPISSFGKTNSVSTDQINYDIIPIADLHQNDASGLSLLLGQTVTINGEVTTADQFNGPSFIQDETAGVAIYDPTFSTTVQIGDFVVISGEVAHFYCSQSCAWTGPGAVARAAGPDPEGGFTRSLGDPLPEGVWSIGADGGATGRQTKGP